MILVGVFEFDSSAQCSVKFESKILDIGKQPITRNSIATFQFTNDNRRALRVEEVTADCHCTTVDTPKFPVEYRETGSIKVIYDNHALGFFEQTIEVRFKGCPDPVLLIFRGVIVDN